MTLGYRARPRQSGGGPVVLPGGFTLIETLVVVGIVTVLIGIVAGAAFTVRAMGYRTQCQSNLRGLGVAISLYAADYGTLPLVHRTFVTWGTGGFEPRLPPNPAPDHTIHDCLHRYLKSDAVFVCPARLKLSESMPDKVGYSYNSGASGVALSDVRVNHSRALLLRDPILYPGPHLGKFNCLFLDGHVKAYGSGTNYAVYVPDDLVDWPPR